MAVNAMKYRPLLFSERTNVRDIDGDGDLDLTLCRASCTAMGFDATTLGEWTTSPNGQRWGRARISTALERMRRATGEPNRPGYNTSHTDDFLRGVGAPTEAGELYIRTFPEILKSLEEGWVISMSGNVGKINGPSPMKKYVNPVPHEMLLTRLSKNKNGIAFIDPMTPHGVSRYERWAEKAHVRQFGSAFRNANGQYVAVRFKRGKYTEAREVARDRARVILQLQGNFANLKKLWEQQQVELGKQDEEIEQLKQQIVVLEEKLEACGGLSDEDLLAIQSELRTVDDAVKSIVDRMGLVL